MDTSREQLQDAFAASWNTLDHVWYFLEIVSISSSSRNLIGPAFWPPYSFDLCSRCTVSQYCHTFCDWLLEFSTNPHILFKSSSCLVPLSLFIAGRPDDAPGPRKALSIRSGKPQTRQSSQPAASGTGSRWCSTGRRYPP